MRVFEDYLGDGVVAYHDGHSIILETEREGGVRHWIALEPELLTALEGYRTRVEMELHRATTQPHQGDIP